MTEVVVNRVIWCTFVKKKKNLQKEKTLPKREQGNHQPHHSECTF